MNQTVLAHENIDDFYKKQGLLRPNELGHFNITRIDDLATCILEPIPYLRRNFYKISLLKGKYKVHFSERTYTIHKQALVFSNPIIPYNWVPLEGKHSGAYVIFTPEFFHQFGALNTYEVFQTNGKHIVELDDDHLNRVEAIFMNMEETFNSKYRHKFDLLRNQIFELVHLGSKLVPQPKNYASHSEASKRITADFLELLERQFPIESMDHPFSLTSPSDFADRLSLHVNYLNRILKKTMGTTTTALIGNRILREAKVLLKHSTVTIAEIAYLLGFKEAAHFSSFFKKNEGIPPSEFRKV